jgi:hypothetical protein
MVRGKSIIHDPDDVCLQKVLDSLDQKLKEGFGVHISLFSFFSKPQIAILLPSTDLILIWARSLLSDRYSLYCLPLADLLI